MTVPHAEWPDYDSGQHTPQTEKNHQIAPKDTCHGSHPDKAYTPSHQAQAGHCPSTQKDPRRFCKLQKADPCAELGRLTQPPRRRARPPAGSEDSWNPAVAHLDPAHMGHVASRGRTKLTKFNPKKFRIEKFRMQKPCKCVQMALHTKLFWQKWHQ